MNVRNGMFKIIRPERHLHFTGERITTEIAGEVEAEHYHRYCFARDFCVGRDVLDIASGEGYGAAILADVARSVIGVERDADAVAFSKANYVVPALNFLVGDALDIPLADASIDVVVSFETLEHVRDQTRFLNEIKRVLRPDGLLIISTPDRNIHSGIGMPVNPYHVHELSGPEFDDLLDRNFACKQVLSQRAIAGSVMLPSQGPTARGARTYDRRDEVTIEATDGVARAVYLIGLASDAPLPDVPPSVFAGPRSLGSLWGQIDADAARNAELARQTAQNEERARSLAAQCEQLEAALQGVTGKLGAAEAECDRLQTALQDVSTRLAAAESEKASLAAQVSVQNSSMYMKLRRSAVRLVLFMPAPVQGIIRGAVGRLRAVRHAVTQSDGRTSPPAPNSPKLDLTRAFAALTGPADVPSVKQAAATQIPEIRPLTAFATAAIAPRVTIVTDSISPSSLFGGVGTSLILGAMLARRLQADLRIVTRTEPPDASAVGHVLDRNGVAFAGRLETLYVPRSGEVELPLSTADLFLSTSWWTTREALSVAAADRVVALVQEDERMFYEFGYKRLLCQETLAIPGLTTVVNTRLLFDHLTSDHSLAMRAEDAFWFEPAFPAKYGRPGRTGRRKLFFYARPNHPRNLFWRGVEALDCAIMEGAFPAKDWQICFVGKDVPPMRFANGVEPVLLKPMAWGEYQQFVASVDAGFVLMDTPHPSYPPLDVAAAGGAVLTNSHGLKASLETYSANILVAPTDLTGLTEGLHRLQALAQNEAARDSNRATDGIQRDWSVALEPLVEKLAQRLQKEHA